MGRRMTDIHLPGRNGLALGEWDEQPADVMIKKLREYAAHLRAQAEAVENAADHEFQIQSHTGVHVQRNRREIQLSSRLAATSQKKEP